jgi:hypothetical protein
MILHACSMISQAFPPAKFPPNSTHKHQAITEHVSTCTSKTSPY